MRILVVGAGVIGSNLATYLAEENHDVYLIENDSDIAQKLRERADLKVITGNGSDPDILSAVAVAAADLVIAVTSSDETNLVVCELAAIAGAKRRIARVRSSALSRQIVSSAGSQFFVDEIINPEEVTAFSIAKTILTPGSREVTDFADGRILLRAFDVPENSPLCKMKISELSNEDFPWPFLILFVVRKDKVIVPKGDTVIAADDRISVLLPAPSLGEFLTFVNPDIRMPQKVVIYGATAIGKKVAEHLTDKVRDIVILEESDEQAELAAGQQENVRIVNGSACETEMLNEAGIEAADAFIAASASDHSNLISAVLAKKLGAKNTIIVTKQPDFMGIVDVLNIDAVVNPRLLAVHQILRFVRGKSVQAVSLLRDCDAEALQLTPEEGSAVTLAALKEISFPKNALVGAVSRGKEVSLANGETRIQPGDQAIVFCQSNAAKKVQELFVRPRR